MKKLIVRARLTNDMEANPIFYLNKKIKEPQNHFIHSRYDETFLEVFIALNLIA